MNDLFNNALIYIYQSPFILFLLMTTAIIESMLCRSLEDKMDGGGLFAMVTLIASFVGGLQMAIYAVLLSIKVHWYYFFLALLSIPLSFIISLILGAPIQELASFIGKGPNKTTWTIQNFITYPICIIFFFFFFWGLFKYVYALP